VENPTVVTGPDNSPNVVHRIYPNGLKLTPEQLDPNVGGWHKKCRHIYEYVGSEVCPDCGRYTHENNWQQDAILIRENYTNGNHEKHLCPECGGTIRGWWDI
jgi:rRNA maturation protein Nop10